MLNICDVSIFLVRPKVYIEQKALDTITYLCDGDARTGLNGLQLAVQAQVGLTRPGVTGPGGSTQKILVTEEHIKEGLQRSHILYDKAGKAAPPDHLPKQIVPPQLMSQHGSVGQI